MDLAEKVGKYVDQYVEVMEKVMIYPFNTTRILIIVSPHFLILLIFAICIGEAEAGT